MTLHGVGPKGWMPIGNPGQQGGHNDGPGKGGRDGGKGDNGNHNGWNKGDGAGVGLNVGLNVGVGGLNVGVGLNIGLGGFGASGASLTRPNDEPTDADAVARLRRQSESIDLQSGRDAHTSAFTARGAPSSGQAGPAVPVGPTIGGDAGLAGGFGAPVGKVGVGQGGGAAQTGVGGGPAIGLASGFAAPAGAQPAVPGAAPMAAASLDRLVTALVEHAPQAGPARGPAVADAATPQRAFATPVPAETAALAAQRATGETAPGLSGSALAGTDPTTRWAVAQTPAAVAQAAAGPAAAAPPASPTQPTPMTVPQTAPGTAPQTSPGAQPPGPPIELAPAARQGQAVPPEAMRQPSIVAAAPPAQTGPAQAAPAAPPPSAQPVMAQPVAAHSTAPLPSAVEAPALAYAPASQQAAAASVASQVGPMAVFAAPAAPVPAAASSPFQPVEPIAALGPRAAGEALVARQIVAIEQIERTGGSTAAIREVGARVRDLPADTAAQVLTGVQPVLARSAESMSSTQRIERVNGILERSTQEVSSHAAMARAGTDLAAALDAGGLLGASAHVTQDVARAIANGDRSAAERAIAFGEAVAVGAGVALPFALIEAFDEKGDGETARRLETALAGGLARLLRRLTEAVDALSRSAGPVAFEWAAWRAAGLPAHELERRLRARLAGREGLVDEIDDALEAVDRVGTEMVRALERLSRWTARTPEIVAVWREATASRKTAFAIAQSLGAQHIVAQALAAGLRSEPPVAPDDFTIEAARRLYESFGFAPGHAAELGEISAARHEAVQMTGGWMRARRPRDPSSEAAFARIVAFLSGCCAPSNRHIETVTFADLDPDGERPITLVGAPLLERFDLMEAA